MTERDILEYIYAVLNHEGLQIPQALAARHIEAKTWVQHELARLMEDDPNAAEDEETTPCDASGSEG